MTGCPQRGHEIARWLDGTLDDAAAMSLEQHAATCALCEAAMEAQSRLPVPPNTIAPPESLRTTILARQQVKPRSRMREAILATAGLAAAVTLMTVLTPKQKSATDFPGAGAVLLAGEHARPLFVALDSAEAELTNAVQAAPDDPDLLSRLRGIRDQRAALHELISEAPN